jgi:pyruvate/2-oxoglutarate dehydrogenase complex dihydrolipoamide acyltransferase (E2) component
MREGETQEQAAYWLRLPDLGEGLAEATVVEWFADVGDRLSEGQHLVNVETDKAIVEIPSPRAGTLAAILAPAGSRVPVEADLARIDPG